MVDDSNQELEALLNLAWQHEQAAKRERRQGGVPERGTRLEKQQLKVN